ncbi:MAG TPA: peptidylprolyl isomerase [Lacunisphaera sp.]|nr:peptidylprolyl isomerase [Lacunisphaera sp.]
MRLLKILTALASIALLLRAEETRADGLYAEFTTPRGAFTVALDYERVPMTVANFVGLTEGTIAARDGKPYYTGLKWYRVAPGFVIQSGNPNAPDEGDPGYDFPDEIAPGLHHAGAGILSMANAGPDTNGGEFFLTLADCTRLNYLHSVFGRVVAGLEVLPQIKPNDPFSIKIIRIGEHARAFKADEASFQALAARAKKYADGANASGPVSVQSEPGPTAHFDDPDGILPTAPPRARGFNIKLANFERFTGRRIVARLSAQPPPAAEDEVAGAYMKALAARLGVARTGVLVAYFADDDWRVWFGDDIIPLILGRPAVAGDLGEGGALHDAKEALMTAALKKGDEAFAAQQKTAPSDRPTPPGQRIKLQTDSLLDTLILRLEPSP